MIAPQDVEAVAKDVESIVGAVLAIWGIIALIGGPLVFFKARKYFPERREAITPEQLNASLEKMEFGIREATNTAIGRVQTAFEYQIKGLGDHLNELKDSMRDAHRRASEAKTIAGSAEHKADIVGEKVNGLEKLMMSRLDHFETLLRGERR